MIVKMLAGDDRYSIDEHGILLNLKTGKRITGTVATNGYRVVNLYDRSSKKDIQKYIHRLVCETFHGSPPKGKKFVNHKDGNKLNNHYLNLEWCNAKHNAIHASENELLKFAKPVVVWDVYLDIKTTFKSIAGAKREIKAISTGVGSVQKSLDGNYLIKKRYWINYLDDIEDYPCIHLLRENYFVIKSGSTGKEYLVTSIGDACKALGGNMSTKYYSGTKAYKGYLFRKYNDPNWDLDSLRPHNGEIIFNDPNNKLTIAPDIDTASKVSRVSKDKIREDLVSLGEGVNNSTKFRLYRDLVLDKYYTQFEE